MKTSYRVIFFIFIACLLTVSCRTGRIKSTPGANLNVQVNLSMDDLEYVGEINGSATQSYVMGLPIGGRRRHYGEVGIISGGSIRTYPRNRGFNNALYDALTSKPDVDFVIPISVSYEVERMFLGRKVKTIIKAKAFKIKTKTSEPDTN